MPGIARLNAGVVRIGRQLAKRRNIMWRLEFDLSLEQNSPDQPEKRVQNGRSATRLNVASRCELPLLGSNQDSPDPERRPADQIFRQIVTEPRVRNVRCREERPKMSGVVGGNGDRNDDTERVRTTGQESSGAFRSAESRAVWWQTRSPDFPSAEVLLRRSRVTKEPAGRLNSRGFGFCAGFGCHRCACVCSTPYHFTRRGAIV